MNRTLPALAPSAALCFAALAQPAAIPQPKPAMDEPAMKMGAGISAMPGEQMQKMHATMGKWMPMMTKMMKRPPMV